MGQVIAVAGSLVGVRMLTGLLAPEVYGELALGMTVATLVNQSVLGPLGNGIVRFYAPAVEQGDSRGYLNAVRRLVLLATGAIAIVILFTLASLLVSGHAQWIVLALAAFIFAILSGYNSILSGIQNAARQRRIVALHQGAESWVRFLIAAGLVLVLGATSTVAMIGFSIAIIFVLASQSIFFRRIVFLHKNQAAKGNVWLKQMWGFSWPFTIFGVFTWMQLASDRWALGLFSTMQDVGRYAVLYQLGCYPIAIAGGMVAQFFTPIFYQRAGDAQDSQRNASVNTLSWRLISGAFVGIGFVFFITLLLHSQIFKLFVAKEYLGVSHLLPWMFLGGGIFAVGQIIALNLQSQMKIRQMMIVKIATALAGVGLNFIGAFLFQIPGIVIANILFSLLFFICMAAISR